MQEKCCTCDQDIKSLKGRYITPNGTFCVLCYEIKEAIKYVPKKSTVNILTTI